MIWTRFVSFSSAAPFAALCSLMLLALPACDSAGGDSDTLGSDEFSPGPAAFRIAGGGADESYDLRAHFGTITDPETGQEAFSIYLYVGDSLSLDDTRVLITRISGRPETGTYAFGNAEEDDDGAYTERFALVGGTSDTRVFYSNSGSLTITSSSSARIEGRFDVAATLVSAGSELRSRPVTIAGSFGAPRGKFVEGIF